MSYVLFILFILGVNSSNTSIATAVAEFATIEACWDASSSIRDGFTRSTEEPIKTVTTCVPKGQETF